MEEKRIDPLQIIGFFLLFLVLIWMMYEQSEMMEQNAQAQTNVPTQKQAVNINTRVRIPDIMRS